jgi:hypothetical protein
VASNTSGRMLGICYILCMSSSVYIALVAQGGEIPPRGGSGIVLPRKKKFLGKRIAFLPHFSCCLDFHVHCWEVFRHIVFINVLLFPVKELGLLTNPGHWVRVLDASVSYMYILL